jgi:hypothetical protein
MDCNSWNSGEAGQLPNRRKWIMLKDIMNCLIKNDCRWFLGASRTIEVNCLEGRYLVTVE